MPSLDLLRSRAAAATLFATLLASGAFAQDDKPPTSPPPQSPPAGKPAEPAKPAQEKPAPQGPQKVQVVPQGGARRASGATMPVASIEKLRNGRTAAIARGATAFDLDLSGVDWKSDPLLLVDGAPVTR